MSERRLTLDQYAAALRRAGGDRAAAAKILGCPASRLHTVVRFHPDLRALCVPPELPNPPQRYRPRQVANAVRKAGGNLAQAARLLGCCRLTVRVYVERYPEVRAALDACPPRLKSAEQVVDALREAGGNRGKAAKLLGLSRSGLLKYIHRYPAAREVCAALDRARRQEPLPPEPRAYAQRFSPAEVAEALREASGIKLQAAKRLGCDRGTVAAYIKRYPEVHEAWIDGREGMVDLAQSKLQEAVERGEWAAVHYTLATLGKERGFTTQFRPAPAGPDDKCERCRAKFMADLERVYGEKG